jgi:hypothetical protein
MIKEILESEETINRTEFTVPLTSGNKRNGVDQIGIRIIFGKVRNQKIPFSDKFTSIKIAAVATGEAYYHPWGEDKEKTKKLTTSGLKKGYSVDSVRDFVETKVSNHNSEREAIIQTIRDLSCDVYENTLSVYGVRPETIFTQIMLGLIIGDTPPPPSVRGSSAPLRNVRAAIQSDFIAGASSERIKNLGP